MICASRRATGSPPSSSRPTSSSRRIRSRRLPGTDDASIAYGFLPPGLVAEIRDRLLALVSSRTESQVPRT